MHLGLYRTEMGMLNLSNQDNRTTFLHEVHLISNTGFHPENSLSKPLYSKCLISEILIRGLYGGWSRNLHILIGEVVLGNLGNIPGEKAL